MERQFLRRYDSCVDMIAESKSYVLPPQYTLKVLCRIWKQGMQSGFHQTRTVFYKETFTWDFEKFNNCQKTTTKPFRSASCHFTINLSKSGSYAKPGTVKVKIVQTEGEDLQFARCYLDIVYADRKEPDSLKQTNFVHGTLKNRSWSFLITPKLERLFKDSLPLQCEFTIANVENWIGPLPKVLDPPLRTTLQTENVQRADPLMELGKDLWRMYSDKKFCDVTLKSSSGKKFPAHKNILSAKSTVFDSIFKDKTLATIDIPDMDSSTLSRMLMFIYGYFPQNLHWKEACELYAAAHKYDLQSLQQECLSIFEKGMSIRNACEALGMTEVHENGTLKKCVSEFIHDNYEEVIESDEWKALEENKPKLVIQVLRDMGRKKFKKSD